MANLAKAAALVMAACLFGAAVYRATTLSVTVDEAYTYTQFASRPLRALMTDYDANNHVLHTLLVKASTGALGASDLTLRLPALFGAALFYGALYRLVLGLLGGRANWWLPVGIALIGANTLIADLLPLARGYGLALGLFTLGLSFLIGETRPRSEWAGVAMGLAVAANLTLAFPVCGVLAGAAWLDGPRQGARTMACAALPAAALLIWPLWGVTAETFYYGAATPVASLRTLAGASLLRNMSEAGPAVTAGMVVIALALAATVAAGAWLRRDGRALFLLASPIAAGALLLTVANLAAGLPFPYGRTGLAWLLLAGLGMIGLASRFRFAAFAVAPAAAAALYFYQAAWSTRATIDWEWDAGTREIAEHIAAQPRPPGEGAIVRVGASAGMAHTLNYYRLTRGWTWLADVRPGALREGRHHYYAVFGEDRAWVEAEGMTILYEDPVAHSILAKPNYVFDQMN